MLRAVAGLPSLHENMLEGLDQMDERLTLISRMVERCEFAADIGTDHGYLICALARQGICDRGIAADINQKPLAKAEREIALQGLTDRVQTVCTDGLNGIGRVDAVILAGMGGELITRIIDCWIHRLNGKIKFYLQPMTKAERLREYLFMRGYTIQSERCCVAAGRPYSVMKVVYLGQLIDYSPVDCWLGAVDLAAGPDELLYCQQVARNLKKKVRGLEAGTGNPKELPEYQALLDAVERKIIV